MAEDIGRRGYFSILRWRRNPTRDEAKNIGVVLVEPEGEFGGIRKAPPSGLPQRLKEQGMIGDLLKGFAEQFESEHPPNLDELNELRAKFVNALVFTEPRTVLVKDKEKTLDALYKAYVQSTAGYAAAVMTKGVLQGNLARTLSGRGYEVKVSEYINDFIFDLVFRDPSKEIPIVTEVLSFANSKQKWTAEEHDAGHFLYALHFVDNPPLAMVEPPTEISLDVAITSYERVMDWFGNEDIEVLKTEDLDNGRFPSIE